MGNNLQTFTGLSILYDMEKNNYLMARAVNRLNRQISGLGLVGNSAKPQLVLPPSKIPSTAFSFFCVFGAIGGFIGAINAFIKSFDHGFLAVIFGGLLAAIVYFFLVGFCVGLVGAVLGALLGRLSDNKSKRIAEEVYANQMKKYQAKMQHDNLRVEREIAQRNLLIQQRDTLLNRLKESESRLQAFYIAMQIDSKFRNIIPIGYMFEFSRLGIAQHFDGTNGLYYLTMEALRQDQLQRTLIEISEKLDQIIENQHRLKDDIRALNVTCDRLLNETIHVSQQLVEGNRHIENIEENTELSAYHAERAAKELEYQNLITVFYLNE